MAGAFLVIVLCGLLLPIGMVLTAVVFDAVVVAWATYRLWHDDWAPRITRSFMHLHVPRLGHHPR